MDLSSKKILSVLLSVGVTAACSAPEEQPAPLVETESNQHGLTHHVSVPQNSRGVSAFAGSVATARDSNYRVRFVVGAEMPIGEAQDATHRFLLGPMAPPGTIDSTITPLPQPERATYAFAHESNANWSLKLYRKLGSECSHGVHERTANNLNTLTGVWAGLSPGASYCWRATATSFSGMVVRTGEFSLAELPAFVNGPSASEGLPPHQLAMEVQGEIDNIVSASALNYETGDCTDKASGLTLAAVDNLTFPGELPVDNQFTTESWIRLSAAAQNKNIYQARGGKLKIRLNNGRPTVDFTLTGAANLLTGSDQLGTAPWSNEGNGAGPHTNFSVTPNYNGGMAPDGSFTATRFQRTSANVTNDAMDYGQLVNLAASTDYTLKVWLRSTTGESQRVAIGMCCTGVNGETQITADGTWQEYTLNATPMSAGANRIRILMHRPNRGAPWTESVDVLVWNPRLSVGPESTITLASSQAMPVNQWVHLATTYDGSTARLFMDGIARAAQGRVGRLADAAPGELVGATLGQDPNGAADSGFEGEVASMAVYDRGLTGNEITARFQRGETAELNGEVAWWPLDELAGAVANDVAGAAQNAQLNNMANDDWVEDSGNQVLDFDGQDDHVVLGGNGTRADIGGKSRFSMSLRFKAREVSREQALYSTETHRLLINGGRIRGRFVGADGMPTSPRGSVNIEPNRWYHVHVIYDGGRIRWYVNGALDFSAELVGPLQATGSSFNAKLGVRDVNSGTGVATNAFNGRLDDVRIFGAVGAWRFDEAATVQSVYDSTRLGYAGHRGASHLAEASDPTSNLSFQTNVSMGPRNMLRDTISMSPTQEWTSSPSGGGTADFTVTSNYPAVTAPDGTNTAIRIQRQRASNTDIKDYVQVLRRPGNAAFANTDRILSFSMRSTSGALEAVEYGVWTGLSGGGASSGQQTTATATLDGNWQEYSVVVPGSANVNEIQVQVLRHRAGTPATQDILIWGVQLAEGSIVDVYQPTNAAGQTSRPSARLNSLTGGPTFCYQVSVATPLGTITSAPLGTFGLPSDGIPPVVTVNPVTVLAECDRPNAALLTIPEPAVQDNVDPNPFVQAHLNSQAGQPVIFPYAFVLGSTVLHWRAEDDSGNVGWSNPDQTIRVRDTTDPLVTGGAPLVVEATSPAGTVYTPLPISSSDVCDTSLTITHTPSTPFPLGDTTVTFTVADDSQNEGTAVRIVRVVDTTPPVFDPAIQDGSISRDGSTCFQPTLATPTATDNAYRPSQLTITNTRISGPGMPNCWDPGTHVVEWTVVDPSGNRTVERQTIEIVAGALTIDNPHLEVTGLTNPPPRRFYNQEVHYVFGLSDGTSPYQVSVTPQPTRLISNPEGTLFRAVYTAEGAYPNILVAARDDNGNGLNFGSFDLPGFGIDLTPPTISPNVFAQSGVSANDPTTYPPFYRGESVALESIWAVDAAWELANLGGEVLFTGSNVITRVPSSTPLIASSASAVTVEAWVRVETLTDGTILQVPRNGATSDSRSAVELQITAAGKAVFEVDGGVKTFTSDGVIRPRTWHHIAAIYSFNGGALKMYVDGEPAAFRSSTASGSGVTLGGRPYALVVGGMLDENDQLNPSFNGELAEIHISQSALTEADVKNHYRGGLGRPVTPTGDSVVLYAFAGNAQLVSDGSTAGNHGVLGTDSNPENLDPTRDTLEYPAESASSGMERIQVVVERLGGIGSQSNVVVEATESPTGLPIQVGTRVIGGLACTTTTNGACNINDPMLRASVLRIWTGTPFSDYRLTVIAEDSAGNISTQSSYFNTSNYQRALSQTIAQVTALQSDPLYTGVGELEDSLLSFRVALSYWTMSSQYVDGSYLRADQGVQYLVESENMGVNVGSIPNELARALFSEVNWHIEGLGANTHPDDQGILDTGIALVETARFEGFRQRAGHQIAASRLAYDSVALLYPAYREMRNALRTVRDRWAQGLENFDLGIYTADRFRTDQLRFIQIRNWMADSRDTLKNVMYPQITAALANPFTTERRTLEEIQDVLDKTSSTDIDEIGDLIAITNVSVADACLDRLAELDLSDDIYTRCYLRLNDLAQFLDSVSEPLVHTYIWRTGLGLVLFNMLEMSMYVSPTSLAFITAPVSAPDLRVVLPDQQAAAVNGAVAQSTVDFPDNLLQTAYSRHAEARTYLDSGAINSAWAIFVDERCLLLGAYNRYYSTMRTIPNVADPKESPIDPATVGCGGN